MTSPCPVVRTLTAAIDCAKQTHNVTGVTSQLRPSPGLRLVATVTNVPGLISGRLHLLLQNFSRPLHSTSTFYFYCCLLLSAYLHLQRRHSWFPKMKRGDMSGVLPWPVYSSSSPSLFCATLYLVLITARETCRGRAQLRHWTIQVLNRTSNKGPHEVL